MDSTPTPARDGLLGWRFAVKARSLLPSNERRTRQRRSRNMTRNTSGLWWATMGLLLVSAALNVVQARRIQPSARLRASSAHLGQRAEPIVATDVTGKPTWIRFDQGRPTVLYYFSPSCHWCERNWDNVREIASQANARYRVVAISSDPTLARFVDDHRFSFEVYGGVSDEARFALGLTGTPHTVVVSAQGIISHDWSGAYTGSLERTVEDLLHVSLPGLMPDPPAR